MPLKQKKKKRMCENKHKRKREWEKKYGVEREEEEKKNGSKFMTYDVL